MESNLCPTFSSLIEEDILKKLEAYFALPDALLRAAGLASFITWFDNPLLLWDMMHESAQSLDFYIFIERIHSVCQLYVEGKKYEEEAYQSLVRIYRQQRSLLRLPSPTPPPTILPPSLSPPPVSALPANPLPFYSDPTLEVDIPSYPQSKGYSNDHDVFS